VIGNIVVQAIAARRIASLAEARRHVAAHVAPARFDPKPSAPWPAVRARYQDIETRLTPR
jgi:hypothetical protein